VSRKGLFANKGRRVAVLAAGLGACALLAACAPVQAGSAAIVGDQRITVSSLDTQVSNLQEAAKPYNGLPLTTAEMPAAVLTWMIRIQLLDEVAAANGITVTDAQAQAELNKLTATAQQAQYKNYAELLIANGVPPQMFQQLGRLEAQQTAYAEKLNGGKPVTTTAEQNAVGAAAAKGQCEAAKSLNIKVSPQFGRLDYTQYVVVPAPDTLSRPTGTPSAASTTGLVPAC
jgi:peptidyl-prolyl cis-trans isomerase SurA